MTVILSACLTNLLNSSFYNVLYNVHIIGPASRGQSRTDVSLTSPGVTREGSVGVVVVEVVVVVVDGVVVTVVMVEGAVVVAP